MTTRIRIIVAVFLAVLSCVAFGQVNSNQAITLPSCANVDRSGRRIVSPLEIVEFYVPRFAQMTKAADVDYVKYYVRYKRRRDEFWLKFMLGSMVGGYSPDDLANTAIKWTAKEWSCRGVQYVTDWRGIGTDGRKWRHIGITLGGFAEYKGVSANAAQHFDKILDTMCCGRCRFCAK